MCFFYEIKASFSASLTTNFRLFQLILFFFIFSTFMLPVIIYQTYNMLFYRLFASVYFPLPLLIYVLNSLNILLLY